MSYVRLIGNVLARAEVKFVARRVLEALSVLHREGFVHTGTFAGTFTNIHNLADLLIYRHQAKQRVKQSRKR